MLRTFRGAWSGSIAARIYLPMLLLAAVGLGTVVAVAVAFRGYVTAEAEVADARQAVTLTERINGLVYAVVMDSRGLYAAKGPADIRNFGKGLEQSLVMLGRTVDAWQALLPAGERAIAAPLVASLQEFDRFRRGIVEAANREGAAAADRIGNNEANRANRKRLQAALEAASAATDAWATRTAAAHAAAASRAIWLCLAAGSVIALATLGFVMIETGRGIVRPLREVTTFLHDMAQGRLDARFVPPARGDEIGRLAHAAAALQAALRARAAADDAARIEAEASAEHAARREAATRRFTEGFAESLAGVVRDADAVAATAGRLQALAQDASTTGAALGAEAGTTAQRTVDVAAGTEELAAAIGEIARQTESAGAVAREARDQAESTSRVVRGLSDAAARIGDSVALIGQVAAQTNLLALNATIEAARAGEAGRGFAVVAGEVKALAGQTARAAEDITAQVAAITAETGHAVEAIGGIAGIIARIGSLTTAIAAAVGQQNAATGNIAQNVAEASRATGAMTERIEAVSSVGRDNAAEAARLSQAAQGLTANARDLKETVDAFVTSLAA